MARCAHVRVNAPQTNVRTDFSHTIYPRSWGCNGGQIVRICTLIGLPGLDRPAAQIGGSRAQPSTRLVTQRRLGFEPDVVLYRRFFPPAQEESRGSATVRRRSRVISLFVERCISRGAGCAQLGSFPGVLLRPRTG